MSDSFHKSLQAALDRQAWAHIAVAPDPLPDAEYCTALTIPGRLGNGVDPPEADEFCDAEAVDDESYCERHLYLSDSWETF